MRRPVSARSARTALLLIGVVSCTNAQLYDLGETGTPPVDRQVQLQGSFCTLGPNQVVSPIKILFIMDASGSMRRSDPTGSRATAVVNLIQSLPADPNIYFAVMLFAGFDTRFFDKTNGPNFDQIISYTQTDLDALVASILNYTNTGASGPNVGNTDFVKPLTTAYAMIDNDIATSLAGSDAGVQIAPARYVSIFLSDGAPTIPEDPAIIQWVGQIAGLSEVTESCVLDTVHISPQLNEACTLTNGVLQCSALQFAEDAQRLQLMAQIGNGQFRDFQDGEPINFLSFSLGTVRRTYVLTDFYASNFSAPPDSTPGQVDSDSDGLSDWLELDAGLDPRDPDTDHDGFSDGVEWYLQHNENAKNLDPKVFNPGCAPNLIHVDSDCDGIWDCDEQLLGGNSLAVDTDFDGAPDGIEWRLGTQLATKDLGFDPDSDGLLNGTELRLHTNPQVADADDLSVTGYRYEILANGPLSDAGEQCYDFTVSNVQLANTLDLGRGPGYNDIYLAYAMVPADNPNAPTVMRQLRYQDARYPVDGIKSPADGVILFKPSDFHDVCLPTDPAVWSTVP